MDEIAIELMTLKFPVILLKDSANSLMTNRMTSICRECSNRTSTQRYASILHMDGGDNMVLQ